MLVFGVAALNEEGVFKDYVFRTLIPKELIESLYLSGYKIY